MNDLAVTLLLAALVLGYISVLLVIRLGSLGASRRRIIGLLIELWLTFGLIMGIFLLVQRALGPVPRGGVLEELADRFAQIRQLPPGRQLAAIGGLLAAIALFAHLLWSLHAAQRHAPSDGGSDAHLD